MPTTARQKASPKLSRTRDHQVGLPARRAAAALLDAVLRKKQHLGDALGGTIHGGDMLDLPARDRALARAIVGASLRRRGQIDHVLNTFIERGLPSRAGTLYPILLSGAAQLIFMNVPPHAAIDLAVRLAQWDPRAKRYDKLVNAVLRRVAENGETLAGDLDAARVNTPGWLWDRWARAWGEERTRKIAASQLVEAPLDLTVKESPESWAERLGGTVLPNGSVRVLPKGPIENLPGFADGAWWVQDAAAALPATFLGDIEGQRVADLCAAPGGKTAQLALAGADVVAVDSSETRLKRLEENLTRLGLRADMVQADVTSWRPDALFDAILLDAPCSATGTIRRHPDIPYVKSDVDVTDLAGVQAGLLKHAVSLLKPGGTLVYSTCSLEPEEGEAQIAAAMARDSRLRIEPIEPDCPFGDSDWVKASGMLRTFPYALRLETPELSGVDGFFAARLKLAE